MLAPMATVRLVGKVIVAALAVLWLLALTAGVDIPGLLNAAFGLVVFVGGGLMAKDAAAARAKKAAPAPDVDPITGLPRPPSAGSSPG